MRVWRSLPSPKSPKASSRTLRRSGALHREDRRRLAHEVGEVLPGGEDLMPFDLLHQALARGRVSLAGLQAAIEQPDDPADDDAPEDVGGGQGDVVGAVLGDDAAQDLGRPRLPGHLADQHGPLLVVGLGAVRLVEGGEIGGRRGRLLVGRAGRLSGDGGCLERGGCEREDGEHRSDLRPDRSGGELHTSPYYKFGPGAIIPALTSRRRSTCGRAPGCRRRTPGRRRPPS